MPLTHSDTAQIAVAAPRNAVTCSRVIFTRYGLPTKSRALLTNACASARVHFWLEWKRYLMLFRSFFTILTTPLNRLVVRSFFRTPFS